MNCPAVRDLLPEHALSLLGPLDRLGVQRHLAWCAACRKEAASLEEAGAVFGFTAPEAQMPDGLQERVVQAVSTGAAKESTIRHRMRFLGVAAAVAALVALGGFGWGAVMASRAGDAERRAQEAERLQEQGEGVQEVLDDQLLRPRDRLLFAWLVPNDGAQSDGWGYVVTSPGQPDVVGVNLVGLPAGVQMPVRVWLTGGGGNDRILVVRARRIDASGALEQARRIDRNLSGVTVMVVKDADGRVVLSGFLDAPD
ncbi:MAG: zf-HC2 domain-containing protein [Actinomycetota bacterium]